MAASMPAGTVGASSLHFKVIPWHRRSRLSLSNFDLFLRKSWREALTKGVFLHGVESEPSRMDGDKGFVAVLCRNRATQKRKPQSFSKIEQQLNPESFNFTKVKPGETLFHIVTNSVTDPSVSTDSNPGQNNSKPQSVGDYSCDFHENECSPGNLPLQTCQGYKTSIVINNSPYEFGHSLLVPQLEKLHIQSISLNAIKMGIEVLLKSSHPGFRVMYTSLCAGASVNHLHLHCYYTEYWLNSEAFRMEPLVFPCTFNASSVNAPSFTGDTVLTDCFELDFNDSCVRGFGFIITRKNFETLLPNTIYKIVRYFNDKNIAHNIAIIRGLPPDKKYTNDDSIVENNGGSPELDFSTNPDIPRMEDIPPYRGMKKLDLFLKTSDLVGRVYVFPRVPLYGEKCYRKFLVNVTELFGHLYFGVLNVFNSMKESDVVNALNAVSLSENEFENVKSDVIKMICNS